MNAISDSLLAEVLEELDVVLQEHPGLLLLLEPKVVG